MLKRPNYREIARGLLTQAWCNKKALRKAVNPPERHAAGHRGDINEPTSHDRGRVGAVISFERNAATEEHAQGTRPTVAAMATRGDRGVGK